MGRQSNLAEQLQHALDYFRRTGPSTSGDMQNEIGITRREAERIVRMLKNHNQIVELAFFHNRPWYVLKNDVERHRDWLDRKRNGMGDLGISVSARDRMHRDSMKLIDQSMRSWWKG
jgi:uncharacterized Fe-S cluster-containing MiaB family protein